jgi:hypothetical protein
MQQRPAMASRLTCMRTAHEGWRDGLAGRPGNARSGHLQAAPANLIALYTCSINPGPSQRPSRLHGSPPQLRALLLRSPLAFEQPRAQQQHPPGLQPPAASPRTPV